MRITRMSALSFTQSQHVIRGNNRIPLLLYHRIICLQIKHTLHTRGRRSRTICQALCHFIILPNPLPQPPSPPSVTTVGCVQRTALHKCVIIRKPTIHLLVLRDSSQGHTICGLILCVVPPIKVTYCCGAGLTLFPRVHSVRQMKHLMRHNVSFCFLYY